MTQLLGMEPGLQPLSLHAQNPGRFHGISCLQRRKQAWGGSLGQNTSNWGSRKHWGHEWKAAKAVAVVLPLPTPVTPGNTGSAATGLRAPAGWGLAWTPREAMPHLCPGDYLGAET